MIKYGLISRVDAEVIEKTLSLVMNDFPNEIIHTTEIGIFNGETSRGIHKFLTYRQHSHTAIDNNKDFPVEKPFRGCNLIIGNSSEVYNQLDDNSQHFIFVDGCHAFPSVVTDFFCYSGKVKVGGYMAFHDTGVHIKPFKDYQRMGSKDDPDMYISVRKALEVMGLFSNNINWKFIFDEADENDEAGGICVFQKVRQ